MYLSIYGCVGSLLLCGLFSSYGEGGLLPSCSAWASHCSSFSLCVQVSVPQRHVGSGLRSWALWCVFSVVVAQGLSCPTAYGIFLDQGEGMRVPCTGQVDSLP